MSVIKAGGKKSLKRFPPHRMAEKGIVKRMGGRMRGARGKRK